MDGSAAGSGARNAGDVLRKDALRRGVLCTRVTLGMGQFLARGQACHGVITTAAGRLFFKPEKGKTKL
jgi:hypothetical protein